MRLRRGGLAAIAVLTRIASLYTTKEIVAERTRNKVKSYLASRN